MRVLVTGGAGFIGKALVTSLVAEGNTVCVLDLPEKIVRGQAVEGATYMGGSVTEYKAFENLPMKDFEVIFHLASQTSGLISHEQPALDVDTNVKGTLNVCTYAMANNRPKVIFTSSMAVYGDYDLAIEEGFELVPKSNYGVSKLSAEFYLKLYGARGLNYTILRLFNVYGPGQDYSNLKQGMLSIYVAQLIQAQRINVTGSFDRYRDFIFIDDVVKALLLSISVDLNGNIYNVGTGCRTTVKELLDLLVSCSKSQDAPIENIGGIVGDQFGTFADISKLKGLGWEPEIDLNTGLALTWADAEEVLS